MAKSMESILKKLMNAQYVAVFKGATKDEWQDEMIREAMGQMLSPPLTALQRIREAGYNFSRWAIWAQKTAAWGMQPHIWPEQPIEAPQDVSKVYIWMEPDTGEISISAYPCETTEYEANHMKLVELRNGKPNKHDSVLNIVRNVLSQTGLRVVID